MFVLRIGDIEINRITITDSINYRCSTLLDPIREIDGNIDEIRIDVDDYYVPDNLEMLLRTRMVRILQGDEEDEDFIKHHDVLKLFGCNPPTIVERYTVVNVPYDMETFDIPDNTDILIYNGPGVTFTGGHGMTIFDVSGSGVAGEINIVDGVHTVDISLCADIRSLTGCYGTRTINASYSGLVGVLNVSNTTKLVNVCGCTGITHINTSHDCVVIRETNSQRPWYNCKLLRENIMMLLVGFVYSALLIFTSCVYLCTDYDTSLTSIIWFILVVIGGRCIVVIFNDETRNNNDIIAAIGICATIYYIAACMYYMLITVVMVACTYYILITVMTLIQHFHQFFFLRE